MSSGEAQIIQLPVPEILETRVTMPMATPIPPPFLFSAKCNGCGSKSCSGSCSSKSCSSCNSCGSSSCSGGCESSCSSVCESSCSKSCDSCGSASESCGCGGGKPKPPPNHGNGGNGNGGHGNGGGNRPIPPGGCNNRTIFVDEKCGTDSSSASPYSKTTVYKTLEFAMSKSTNGDTIRVAPGTYPFGSVKDRILTIVGSGPTTEILFGGNLREGSRSVSPSLVEKSQLYAKDLTVNFAGRTELLDYSKVHILRDNVRVAVAPTVDSTSEFDLQDNTVITSTLPIVEASLGAALNVRNNSFDSSVGGVWFTENIQSATTSSRLIRAATISDNYFSSSTDSIIFGIVLPDTQTDMVLNGLTNKLDVEIDNNTLVIETASGKTALLDTSNIEGADQLIKLGAVGNRVRARRRLTGSEFAVAYASENLEIDANSNTFEVDGLVYDKNRNGAFVPNTDIIYSNDSKYEGKISYTKAQKIVREDQEIDFSAEKIFFTRNFSKDYELPQVDNIDSVNNVYPSRTMKFINQGDGYIRLLSRARRPDTDNNSNTSNEAALRTTSDGSKNKPVCRDCENEFVLGASSVLELSTLDGEWVNTTDTD